MHVATALNSITNIPLSNFQGRKRLKWFSFVTSGCHNDQYVYVIYHCPVVAGVAQLHLAWQHRVCRQNKVNFLLESVS